MKLNLLFSEITSPFYERAHTHTTDDRCKGQKGLERRTEKAECTTGEGGGGGVHARSREINTRAADRRGKYVGKNLSMQPAAKETCCLRTHNHFFVNYLSTKVDDFRQSAVTPSSRSPQLEPIFVPKFTFG